MECSVIKRNGDEVPYDEERIRNAIRRAFLSANPDSVTVDINIDKCMQHIGFISIDGSITVEKIQDSVELSLMGCGFPAVAKSFILYRQKRADVRSLQVSDDTKKLYEDGKKYFSDGLSEFVFYRSYSRWMPDKRRRETWPETVHRYITYMHSNVGSKFTQDEYTDLEQAILTHQVMPSMRLLWSAGPPAMRDNAAAYNCSYTTISRIEDFAEVAYLSMCFTGDTKISLLNGTEVPIKDLVGKDEFWVYSYDIKSNKMVPGRAHSARLTRKSSRLVKVILDNNEEVRCTPDHRFLMRDGTYKEAQYLKPQDSLMPLYRKKSNYEEDGLHEYDMCHVGSNEWEFTHRITADESKHNICEVCKDLYKPSKHHGIRHHKDFNRLNNELGNFAWLTWSEHKLVHKNNIGRLWNTEGFKKEHSLRHSKLLHDRNIANWKIPEYRKNTLSRLVPFTSAEVSSRNDRNWANPKYRSKMTLILRRTAHINSHAVIGMISDTCELCAELSYPEVHDYRILFSSIMSYLLYHDVSSAADKFHVRRDKISSVILGTARSHGIYMLGTTRDVLDRLRSLYVGQAVTNHKISRVETCHETEDVYDFIVDDHHNFALTSGVFVHNCGSGVGIEVSKKSVSMLPNIKKQSGVCHNYVIQDSKEGWSDAITMGLKDWFEGRDVVFDYSLIRPAGARLKVMGGKASGPKPLMELLTFIREVILSNKNRQLSPIHVHDIVCKIGEIVVSGGVRRTALISLSDIDDYDIRDCKSGQFYIQHMHRSFSNNSAIYNKKPTTTEFLTEWLALIKSGSGERGIFNRGSVVSQAPMRRRDILSKSVDTNGTNPCGEIVLQSKQQCNLTEIVARQDDDRSSLMSKIKMATMLGTYQSTLTNFRYLSDEWRAHAEEERLLGVSITGQWDCAIVREPGLLQELRDYAVYINKEYSKRLGISQSTCITCVKPSGTTSTLVNSSTGMHARYAPYYIRRVRISATDSLFKLMRDQGFKYYPEVGQNIESCNTYVIEFPVKSPEGAIFQSDLSAIEQLEHWKLVKINYTEHNPSVTITVADDEWLSVANWVYEQWDIVGGLAFLPKSDHNYKLAPYEEIDEDTYNMMSANVVDIDYSKLMLYETTDETSGAKEVACTGGSCDIL